MNQEKARSILRMFSGVAEVKTLDPLLDEAVALVKSRLRPGADTERPQLDYLCAAIANLRHSQLLAAQSQLTYTYAGSVAVECFGIVGMAAVSVKDGLVKLLRRDSLKHGISVRITEDNKIRLNFHVIVAYGVNISTIADNLVSNVKYKVEAFTGIEIEKINVLVEGVRAID